MGQIGLDWGNLPVDGNGKNKKTFINWGLRNALMQMNDLCLKLSDSEGEIYMFFICETDFSFNLLMHCFNWIYGKIAIGNSTYYSNPQSSIVHSH
jgi:hypothetical protein